MSSTFLTLRYIAFALFIIFNSVICIVSALNLGSLALNTPRFPEVDSYLIFLGALGLITVFSVVFVELIRKNAFITRVAVEITWVGILWVMHLSGAAATTAISPDMECSLITPQPEISCISTKVLLAFTWLSTITLLSYLLGLVICAVHHSQADSNVWRSGVRDYRWFTQRKSLHDHPMPGSVFSYGKLTDAKETGGPPPAIYAQQMGLTRGYSIEPLKIETTIERPVPPVPAALSGLQVVPPDGDSKNVVRSAPLPFPQSHSYSLYPQHLQASGSFPAVPPRAGERTPPPAGSWPRSNPQEPLRRKTRPGPGIASNTSSTAPPIPVAASLGAAEQGEQQDAFLSGATRSRPSGPRTLASLRPRPPPLDLSCLTPRGDSRH